MRPMNALEKVVRAQVNVCLQKRRGQGKVSLLQSPIIKHLQDIAWGKERSS